MRPEGTDNPEEEANGSGGNSEKSAAGTCFASSAATRTARAAEGGFVDVALLVRAEGGELAAGARVIVEAVELLVDHLAANHGLDGGGEAPVALHKLLARG